MQKLVLNDADDRLIGRIIGLLSRGLTEEKMAEEMKQPLSDFNLLIKRLHEKFGTENLHGLFGALMYHGGRQHYYSMSHHHILQQTPEPTPE